MRFKNTPLLKLSLSFLLCFSLIGSWSCQKEISHEVPANSPGSGTTPTSGGDAVYTLVASGSNCSDATVSGTFQAGVTLTAAEKVTVTVNVTKTGNWIYTSNLINGFVLAGSGVFTSTGNQSITLQAGGKPIATGTNAFLLPGASSCNISIAVTAAGTGGGGGTPTNEFYYKATIGGVDYMQEVTNTNGYEAGSGMGGLDDVSFGAGIYYISTPVPAGATGMGVEKGLMHNYLAATDARFKAFFTPGTYPYAPPGLSTFDNGDGIAIGWTDPSGNNWDSHAGTADQTGSTFKIISVEDNYDAIGDYYIKVKMQFSCKLYNENTGDMKQLTNGEMVALFGKL